MLPTREPLSSLLLRSLRRRLVIPGRFSTCVAILARPSPNSHRSRYKCFNLTWLHPFCAVLFTVGYALREYGAFNYLFGYKNLAIFIVSQVFIYICPWVLCPM